MPLRRTQRSDGRHRPRWKDGSHEPVESTHANESRCQVALAELNPQTELLIDAPQLLARSHEHPVSTRDRPARTGADARIEESGAIGEVRLALRPYGRAFKPRFGGRDCVDSPTLYSRGCPAQGCGRRMVLGGTIGETTTTRARFPSHGSWSRSTSGSTTARFGRSVSNSAYTPRRKRWPSTPSPPSPPPAQRFP